MIKSILAIGIVASLFTMTACSSGSDGEKPAGTSEKKSLKQMRWYSPQQVALGEKIYLENCASCHGEDAAGSANWQEPDASGKFPPPPLNGSAHTWHHPKNMLRMTIRRGGIPIGGSMPAFGDKLHDDDIDAVIAWVQSHWSGEVYNAWAKRNAQAAIQGVRK